MSVSLSAGGIHAAPRAGNRGVQASLGRPLILPRQGYAGDLIVSRFLRPISGLWLLVVVNVLPVSPVRLCRAMRVVIAARNGHLQSMPKQWLSNTMFLVITVIPWGLFWSWLMWPCR